MSFVDNPQQLWWRKAIFQVHLWAGIILCLYMLVIGASGSILVFDSELRHLTWPHLWKASPALPGGTAIDFPTAVKTISTAYPGYQITEGYPPDKSGDNFEFIAHRGAERRDIFLDANTGKIIGEVAPNHSWIAWTIDLHFHLLGGHTGEIINGIGAAGLILLCITGIIVWWPGLSNWPRALKINLRSNWKRINFDLHSAIGFWTLLILSMWAFTGVYLVWSAPIVSFVNRFSSTASDNPPAFHLPQHSSNATLADLAPMIRIAQQTSPNAAFGGAFFPASKKSALILLMARQQQRNYRQCDYIYFDPVAGQQLAVWHRGINNTWGARLVFFLVPLHFGYDWGLAVKIIWAVLGCALPLLSITGALMYWNRSLSKKWRALKSTH